MSIIWSNPVNRLHPLNRGLVSWWLTTPNARAGVTFRDLAGQNHGTLTNMDPATDWKVGGHRGGYGHLDLDGANDYIHVGVPSNLDNITADITISMWVNADSWTNNVAPGLISKRETFATMDWEWFYQGSGNEIRFAYGNSAPNLVFNGGNVNPSTGVWHHLLITRNGSAWVMYLDGDSAATDTEGTAFPTGENVRIGFLAADAPSFVFDGQIDDVRMYNRGLNGVETRQLYNLSRTGYGELLNRRRRVFKAPAAAPGGNAMPMAMHHYRQRRVG